MRHRIANEVDVREEAQSRAQVSSVHAGLISSELGLTARAAFPAAAVATPSPTLSSSAAVLTFVNFSFILHGGLQTSGSATSSFVVSASSTSNPSLPNESNINLTASSKAALPVGVIVGGSIGGLAVVLLGIVLLVSARNQHNRRTGTTRMVHFKNRPPRSTEVVAFVPGVDAENDRLRSTISPESRRDQNAKTGHIQVHHVTALQGHGRPSNLLTDITSNKRPIHTYANGGGESSVHLSRPPGISVTENSGGTEMDLAGVGGISGGLHAHDSGASFMVEESPPAYHAASGLS